jgi:hypothetical protein
MATAILAAADVTTVRGRENETEEGVTAAMTEGTAAALARQ